MTIMNLNYPKLQVINRMSICYVYFNEYLKLIINLSLLEYFHYFMLEKNKGQFAKLQIDQ